MSIVIVAIDFTSCLAVIVGVIYIQQAVRKIPIQYAKRVTGGNGIMLEHKTLIYHLR